MTAGASALADSTRVRDASYGLALFGVHLAFMPLLVLLLPRRVELLAGGDAATALSWILLFGALAASVSNIAAGVFSDRWLERNGSRRGPVILGLAMMAAGYLGLAAANSLVVLTAAIIAFQVGLNATMSPVSALLTDYIPNAEKGRIAGLANAALPLSSAAIAPLAWVFPLDSSAAFLLVGAIAVACCIPLVALWPFRLAAQAAPALPLTDPISSAVRRDFALAWLARMLIQLGAAFIIGYLYVFVMARFGATQASAAASVGSRLGVLSLAATAIATLSALASGQISDRLGARRLPLAIAAIVAGLALAVLGALPGWIPFIAAYALFHAALAGFLALDTALVAEMLAAHPRRAALLGVMNLTNTVPAVLAPGIALFVLERDPMVTALAETLTICAIGCGIAALAVVCIRSVR